MRAAVALLGTVMLLASTGCGGAPEEPASGPAAEEAAAPSSGDPNTEAPPPAEAPPSADAPHLQATLYFADSAGRLRPEKRDIELREDPALQARAVVEELLTGPRGGLQRVVPAGSRLNALYLTSDGTALVDMSASFARGLASGSEDALAAVWSITDSLGANVEAVRRVKVLVDGEETDDLGGHLDLTRPLVPAVGYSARAVIPLPAG